MLKIRTLYQLIPDLIQGTKTVKAAFVSKFMKAASALKRLNSTPYSQKVPTSGKRLQPSLFIIPKP
jgi:hypothetical protein